MTFVIANKELDLSVGSTFGLTATIFGMIFAPTYFDMGIWTAVAWCLVMGAGDRADQRLHGHGPGSAGLHRDADDAVHRPRRDSRPHRRQEHRLRNQGWGLSRFLPSGRDQRARLQQSNHPVRHHRRGRRRGARLHHDRLDDLLRRRQRASGALRRHQHALRAHALLCALLALRGDCGPDERRAEQGRGPAGRLWPGAHRHFVGDRRRRGDFRRPGADPWLVPRRDPHRPHRQGSARGRPHHPHHRPRQRRDRAGGGGDAIAARRGSGLSWRHPHHRGADRAVARPAPRHSPPLGVAARPAAAARPRSRRRRDLGRPDPRRERAGAGLGQTRARRLLLPPRRGGRDPDGRALAVRSMGEA